MPQQNPVPARVAHSNAEPASVLVRMRDLYKMRQQGDSRFELRVPSLELRTGQFVAVVGSSGCGKSTLLDMLALVLRPSRCETFWMLDGKGKEKDIREFWNREKENQLAELRRRDLGYVLQTGGLMPFLTIEENIRLPMRILGQSISKDDIVALAERIGIRAVLTKKPQHLSGGQRQRAAILRALVHNPRLILADEPTAAVDKPRARAIVAEFKSLARDQGATIVMVTHDHQLVERLADEIYGFDLTEISKTQVRSVCRPLLSGIS